MGVLTDKGTIGYTSNMPTKYLLTVRYIVRGSNKLTTECFIYKRKSAVHSKIAKMVKDPVYARTVLFTDFGIDAFTAGTEE